ncbi:MAG: transcription antitermination factor NusB [Candidatus Liberibacter ctenarytainae]|uniref:Transcription antitermination protein NusB n=1 Tax=Candidatus Liberibacter ctenarytainae TaxID=2020335 RepID=A0A937AKP6_9HYPH|nr:transcription antitermination factor NusB [Candidatus Liberibacter ctenarytainae]
MDTQGDKEYSNFAQKRGVARLSAVQALYQIDIVGCSIGEVLSEHDTYQFYKEIDENVYSQVDLEWFRVIVHGVTENKNHIDGLISSCLTEGWSLARLDLIVCAILRAGLFELINCYSVPVEVIISEYVSIAHAFFDNSEPNFINAVLDRLSRSPDMKRKKNGLAIAT